VAIAHRIQNMRKSFTGVFSSGHPMRDEVSNAKLYR